MQFDLKSFRTDLNLKQTDIQKILGITQGFVSKIENGKESFPSEYVDILSKKYSYDIVKKYIIDESKTSSRIRVSQKLRLIRERLNLSQKEMAEKLNLQQSQYSLMEKGKVDFRMDKVQHLIDLGISPVWFISSNDKTVNDETAAFNLEYNEPSTAFLGTDNNENPQVSYSDGVPYYEDIESSGGIISSMNEAGKEIPTFFINYEHFNDCTAYLQHVGDSMYPKYCSGEIIAVKRIFNFNVVLWGEAYLVVTNDNANSLRTVKLLFQHEDEDKIILRSSNPNFKGDTIISKIDIISMFIVKGKITRNQL